MYTCQNSTSQSRYTNLLVDQYSANFDQLLQPMVNLWLANLGKWLGSRLQGLRGHILINIEDTVDLLYKENAFVNTKCNRVLPRNTMLVKVDALSMNTNIDTDRALEILTLF